MNSTNYLNKIYELLNSGNIELAFTLSKSMLEMDEIELIKLLWCLLSFDDVIVESKAMVIYDVRLNVDPSYLNYKYWISHDSFKFYNEPTFKSNNFNETILTFVKYLKK